MNSPLWKLATEFTQDEGRLSRDSGDLNDDPLGELPRAHQGLADVIPRGSFLHKYLLQKVDLHIHVPFTSRLRQVEPKHLCAVFKGTRLDIGAPHLVNGKSRLDIDLGLSHHGRRNGRMYQPVLVPIVDPAKEGEGSFLGCVMSLVRLTNTDFSDHVVTDPTQPPTSYGLVPSSFGRSERAREVPLDLLVISRAELFTGDGVNQMIQCRPEILRTIANDYSEAEMIGFPIHLKGGGMDATIRIALTFESCRIGLTPGIDCLIEGVQVEVCPVEFGVNVAQIKTGHGLPLEEDGQETEEQKNTNNTERRDDPSPDSRELLP